MPIPETAIGAAIDALGQTTTMSRDRCRLLAETVLTAATPYLLTELHERYVHADDDLLALAVKATSESEAFRLRSKASGLRLADSYLSDMARRI